MIRIAANDLKDLIIKTLRSQSSVVFEEGNPFYLKIDSEEYLFFIKNISPAYFKQNPDITRVQIPSSKHFLNLNDNIPLIVIGYDEANDVIVVWDPRKIRARLNIKSNVSVYSRLTLQKDVNYLDVSTGYLSNNDKILLSKRKNILMLLSTLRTVFEIKTDQIDFKKHIKYNNSDIEKAISSLGSKFIELINSNEKLAATQLLIRELEKKDASFTLKECSDYLKSNYFLN
ncbi:MAG: hypothetical protein NBV56_03070 [Aquirufa antheringensis]|nr:hypothetical protein [Aquirufa antheringensis]